MRPVIVIAALAQPCAPLILGIGPGSAVPTCDLPTFVETAEADRAAAVCAAGDAAWADGRAHAQLQDAIDATPDGEAVLICPGEHIVGVSVRGRTIELSSVSGSALDTVLDGRGSRVLDVVDSVLTVSDLTIRDGQARNGGGIQSNNGSLLLDGVQMTGNGAGYEGGAVQFNGHVFEVRNSSFLENHADYEGGAFNVSESACTHVADSTFEDNVADSNGGAIATGAWGEGLLDIRDSTFTGNYADYGGGAIQASGWALISVVVSGTTFELNTAGYEGGAISAGGQGPSQLIIEDSAFLNNTADYAGGGIEQGGWEDDHLEVRRTVFDGNEAGYEGGGMYIGGWTDQTAILVDVDLLNNVKGGADFSGVHGAEVEVQIDGGTISGNSGGGLVHGPGFMQGVGVTFGPVANTPKDILSECGRHDLGTSTDFTCSNGSWSTP